MKLEEMLGNQDGGGGILPAFLQGYHHPIEISSAGKR